MAKKSKTAFVCTECGQEFSKWQGRCHSCGSWDTVTEFREARTSTGRSRGAALGSTVSVQQLSTDAAPPSPRIASSFPEVDRALGGGLVPGSLVLVGGDPGIGKSTLLLQMLAQWAAQDRTVLYVSGEESMEQVSLRAARLGTGNAPVLFLAETTTESVLDKLQESKPQIVVIDSIQTMMCEELTSSPGSVSQVRESTALLLRFAKSSNTAVVLVGHVTKDGSIAGPRVLEHMVDAVISFEGDANYQYRIFRSIKNRYGPSGEIAVLTMSDRGLAEVKDASDIFLQSVDTEQVGSAVVPVLEGSRVLPVELQALVNHTHFGMPQRVASGINPKKLSLLVAVIERYSGVTMGDHDIFFNVAGGLSISEPAADLGVVAALLSSFRNKPCAPRLAFLGEVGLGGEVRPVNNMASRLRELARMGFKHCLVPPPPRKADWKSVEGVELVTCGQVGDVGDVMFG